tara:strand:- start:6491 stop:6829 length:339 start_codon:yes stop_codon:yes gene_type:complete
MSSITKKIGTVDQPVITRIELLEKQVKDLIELTSELTNKITVMTKGKKRGPKPKVSMSISDIEYIGDDKYKVKTDNATELVIVLSETMLNNIIEHLEENSLYELKNFTTVGV